MSHQSAHDLRTVLDIPRQDFNRVTSILFAYLFGIIKKSEYTEMIDDRLLSKAVLASARSSGYVLLNCKLYAYACWCARASEQPLPRASTFEISPKDASLLRRLNLAALGDRFHAFSLSGFTRVLNRVMLKADLDQYIGKYVTRKMTFLMKSYGVSRHDLETTLLQSALYAIYKQYPRYESGLHLINICKTTIHNVGQNLIQYHTRKKRQALSRSDDGSFSSVLVSLDQIIDVPAEDDEHEVRHALMSLAALEHRMSPKVREFLHCAAGVYHEGLSEFLGKPNDDLVEAVPYSRYLDKLRSYFEISEQQTERLFERLRPHLA